MERNRIIKSWEDRKSCAKSSVQKALDSGDYEQLERVMPPLQLAFANEYIKDFNGSEAVIRAGSTTQYPNRMAYQWLNNPGVRACIDHLMLERTKAMKIDQGYVIEKLIRTVDRAESDKQHASVLRGLELLAKHLGMFIERQEITGKDGEEIKIREVSNEAAAFLSSIAGLAKRAGTSGSTEVTLP